MLPRNWQLLVDREQMTIGIIIIFSCMRTVKKRWGETYFYSETL